ncbi:MAG: ROK family protein [Jatrophihabitans sp.]
MTIPVLEVGGTHVSAALIDPDGWAIVRAARLPLDADAAADALVDRFVEAAAAIEAPSGTAWGVAMPDPFDYVAGVALFAGVGKFGALHGVDVGAALRARLGGEVAFVNDADAFVLGEWAAGAGRGIGRCAGITLGTGVGSGWVAAGAVVDPGDPPGGRIHRLLIDGRPLEDVVSRRALRSAFAASGGDPTSDVRDITALARAGDALAGRVVNDAYGALGSVVGSLVRGFDAEVLLVGGSIAASWDVLEPAFVHGAGGLPPVDIVSDSDRAALVGAAVHASR